MPDSEVNSVKAAFEQLSELLTRDAVAAALTVTHIIKPADMSVDLISQLQQIYLEENKDLLDQAGDDTDRYDDLGVFPPESLVPHRFAVTAQGVQGSVNQLAMMYSRILTPPANLPSDPVVLENAEEFEVPARYPWTVQVYG